MSYYVQLKFVIACNSEILYYKELLRRPVLPLDSSSMSVWGFGNIFDQLPAAGRREAERLKTDSAPTADRNQPEGSKWRQSRTDNNRMSTGTPVLGHLRAHEEPVVPYARPVAETLRRSVFAGCAPGL